MPHPLRVFWPGTVYEITSRTMQGRYLLAPTPHTRKLVLGVLGRAQSLYPQVQLYAFVFLSNHMHMLVSADDGCSISAFVGYVNGNVAREIGRLHDWPGPFWGRRFRPIPILDDDALVARFRYLLAQGAKEGLIASPRDWPGASALPGLLGAPLEGVWVQRNVEYRARIRGADLPEAAVVRYRVTLTPLPCWREQSSTARRALVEGLVRDIELEAEAARRENGWLQRSPAALAAEDPHTRPARVASSPAPVCHTTITALRRRFRDVYRAIRSAFVDAANQLAHGVVGVIFPQGTFPTRLPFVLPEGPFLLSRSGDT